MESKITETKNNTATKADSSKAPKDKNPPKNPDKPIEDIPGRRVGGGTRSIEKKEKAALSEKETIDSQVEELKRFVVFLPFYEGLSNFIGQAEHPVHKLVAKLKDVEGANSFDFLDETEKSLLSETIPEILSFVRRSKFSVPYRARQNIKDDLSRILGKEPEPSTEEKEADPFHQWL